MLRAYLAVIHDSFRAAFASRVLYIMLILIGLILLAVAPFHLKQQVDWELQRRQHVVNSPRLLKRLVNEGKTGKRPAVAHIWSRLSPELQQDIEELASTNPDDSADPDPEPRRVGRVTRTLVGELNEQLLRPDFYDEQAFSGKRLNEEARSLLAKDIERLNDLELRRLNRLLVATALRRDIEPPRAAQLEFYYGPWQWSWLTTSIPHAEFSAEVSGQLLWAFDKFVMSIGIFIAILVTASVIPEMLESGSLNLLLSKPVHRWGLLLARFFGGCAFITLCAALFFSGIWLWMGIQLQLWEPAILYSIPVYLVVFAMYYSVSVLAGILFRSPILCIAFAILFWGVCFAIGFGYQQLSNRYYNTAPLEMVATGDAVMVVDLLQNNRMWNASASDWQTVSLRSSRSDEEVGFAMFSFFAPLDQLPDLPGPAWDAGGGRLLASDAGLPTGPTLPGSSWITVSGGPDQGWVANARGNLPSGTLVLLAGPEGPLAINRSGFVYQGRPAEADDAGGATEEPGTPDSPDEGEAATEPANRPGLFNRRATAELPDGGFEKASRYQEPLDLSGSHSASLNEQGKLALYSRGNLVVLGRDGEDKFAIEQQVALGQQDNPRMQGMVEFRGDDIYVILGNGIFYHVAAGDLTTVWSGNPESRSAVRGIAVSPDGARAALVYRNGRLWLYDRERRQIGLAPLNGQGDLLAVTFDEQGNLWVGDRFGAARAWNTETWSQEARQLPPGDWLTTGFRYLLRPLYRVFPKPGEFYKVLDRLSSSNDARYNPQIDLTRKQQADNPWSPLTSGLLFMVVMLGLSCWIFQRTDY